MLLHWYMTFKIKFILLSSTGTAPNTTENILKNIFFFFFICSMFNVFLYKNHLHSDEEKIYIFRMLSSVCSFIIMISIPKDFFYTMWYTITKMNRNNKFCTGMYMNFVEAGRKKKTVGYWKKKKKNTKLNNIWETQKKIHFNL